MLLENQPIRLLPDSSLLIETEGGTCLVAADLHLGKSAAFRANGLPIPEGDTDLDLLRLSSLIRKHAPSRLVIAGDLFHATSGITEELLDKLSRFVDRIEIPFALTTGNHDCKIKKLPAFLNQSSHIDIDGIRITHKPCDASPDCFNICGHIHPVLKLKDGRSTSLHLPCFHLRGNVLTLPSFGSFTGGQIVMPKSYDRFFLTHRDEVIEVPMELFSWRP